VRITGIHTYSLDLPLAGTGYTFATGKRLTHVDTAVVRVDTDEGLSGWGRPVHRYDDCRSMRRPRQTARE